MSKKFVSEHRRVGTLMLIAVSISMVLMLAGLGLSSASLTSAGIMVLLLTPFLRVIGAVITFMVAEKDLTYTVISLGVLAVLVAGLFVPVLR